MPSYKNFIVRFLSNKTLKKTPDILVYFFSKYTFTWNVYALYSLTLTSIIKYYKVYPLFLSGENGINIQNVLSMGEEMSVLNTLPIEEQLEIIMCAVRKYILFSKLCWIFYKYN